MPRTMVYEDSPSGKEKHERERNIEGIDRNDALHRTIGIQPRQRSSDEIRKVMSLPAVPVGQGPFFPTAMQKIMHPFMVANRYVGSEKHLWNKKALKHSLLVRLDLHAVTSLSSDRSAWNICVANVGNYITMQTTLWQQKGFITRWHEGITPTFHTLLSDVGQARSGTEGCQNLSSTGLYLIPPRNGSSPIRTGHPLRKPRQTCSL